MNNTVTTPPTNSPLNTMLTLWKSCFQQGSPSPQYYNFDSLKENPILVTCGGALQADMWKVQKFFLQNLNQYKNLSQNKSSGCDYDKFTKTLTDQKVPMNMEMLARIYGWVPFNDYCKNASAVEFALQNI